MSLPVTVVIREDPRKTHRAVEALRIALGLAAGENPVTVVLLGEAVRLLGSELEDVIDAELLEKHLPALKELGAGFLVEAGLPPGLSLDSSVSIEEKPLQAIAALVAENPRALVF